MSGFNLFNEAKWFATIKAAERATAEAGPPDPLAPFDLGALGRDGHVKRFSVWFQNRFFLFYFWIARKIWPFPPLPTYWKVVCVTRAADVKQVLESPEVFGVPYGPEMTDIAGGANFALGMDGERHTRQRNIILKVMRRDDAARLAELSGSFARALIFASGGTIDVISDLVTRVAAETCARYFGLDITDPDAFAEWAMSLSALLFADPSGEAATRTLALNGAARVRAVVDRAIRKSRENPGRGDDTLVDRLVALQASGEALSPTDDEMRAILVGMVVGFIPTITLGAARMLEELLRRPKVMKEAIVAAAREDKGALSAILLEAARLNPALQPGQWRYARRDAVIGTGSRRKEIKAGTVLMVATQSALRDGKVYHSPNRFQANRTAPPSLWDFIFGKGEHDCLGTYVAMALITEAFAVLMAQHNLRPVAGFNGGMAWIGPLPRRLDMRFDGAAAPATQTMITVFAPIRMAISTDRPESHDWRIRKPLARDLADQRGAHGFRHRSFCLHGRGRSGRSRRALATSAAGAQRGRSDGGGARSRRRARRRRPRAHLSGRHSGRRAARHAPPALCAPPSQAPLGSDRAHLQWHAGVSGRTDRAAGGARQFQSGRSRPPFEAGWRRPRRRMGRTRSRAPIDSSRREICRGFDLAQSTAPEVS